jgi:hypothetical protein
VGLGQMNVDVLRTFMLGQVAPLRRQLASSGIELDAETRASAVAIVPRAVAGDPNVRTAHVYSNGASWVCLDLPNRQGVDTYDDYVQDPSGPESEAWTSLGGHIVRFTRIAAAWLTGDAGPWGLEMRLKGAAVLALVDHHRYLIDYSAAYTVKRWLAKRIPRFPSQRS